MIYCLIDDANVALKCSEIHSVARILTGEKECVTLGTCFATIGGKAESPR